MLVSDRRKFLRNSAATVLSLAVPTDLFAQAASVGERRRDAKRRPYGRSMALIARGYGFVCEFHARA
jgi:hypothetical protein